MESIFLLVLSYLYDFVVYINKRQSPPPPIRNIHMSNSDESMKYNTFTKLHIIQNNMLYKYNGNSKPINQKAFANMFDTLL